MTNPKLSAQAAADRSRASIKEAIAIVAGHRLDDAQSSDGPAPLGASSDERQRRPAKRAE